jgi:hypothetical protein
MPTPDFVLKSSDRTPPLVVVCKDSTGAIVDLTTAVSAKFIMNTPGGDTAKVDATATISATPTDGVVSYTWLAADVDTAARYVGEIEVTWAGPLTTTYPAAGYLDILVTRELG